jgi:hypothetical protein
MKKWSLDAVETGPMCAGAVRRGCLTDDGGALPYGIDSLGRCHDALR